MDDELSADALLRQPLDLTLLLRRRLVWDGMPCELAPRVCDLMGMTPPGPDGLDAEHFESHARLRRDQRAGPGDRDHQLAPGRHVHRRGHAAYPGKLRGRGTRRGGHPPRAVPGHHPQFTDQRNVKSAGDGTRLMSFWAKKLGGAASPPGATPTAAVFSAAGLPPVAQAPAGSVSDALAVGTVPANTAARSARLTTPCPACNSANYGPVGAPVINVTSGRTAQVTRCYDCGYPVTQSGSGDTLRGQAGNDVRAARQIARSGVVAEPFAHI